MFGYIIPDKPELKIKEFELFRAYYCGICKAIASRYGHIPRFALSYDLTFLAIFLSSIDTDDIRLDLSRCITKPFKKIPLVKRDKAIDYAAGMNIILAYHNIKDDIYDRSYRAYPILPLLYPAYRKAKKAYQEQDLFIRTQLDELRELERENCPLIDQAAKPFSNLLASLVTEAASAHGEENKVLRDFGYNVGKWLYTIDALDDLLEDIKGKNYNPILAQFLPDLRPKTGKIDKEKRKEIQEYLSFVLNYTLKQVCLSYEALDIKRNKSILDNIIYGGMYNKTKQILKKEWLNESI